MIPDAAVEAGAKAIYELWERPGNIWETDLDAQDAYREEAHFILEAAAPHLLARAVAFLDEAVTVISADPDATDYERGFDDATRGMAAKVKRLLNGEAK